MFEQGMFADSLLETSWAHRSRRSLTTLTSFGMQAVLIGLLLMIPILTTVGLPATRSISTPISLGRRDPGPATPQRSTGHPGVQIIPLTSSLMLPRRMPRTIPRGDDNAPQAPIGGDIASIGDFGPSIGDPNGLRIPIPGTKPVMPVAPHPTVHVFRTSTILQGMLIRRVEPMYPPMARAAHIQGPVVLAAVISKDGTIENLRTLSGHPMLVSAAVTAVSQWRYRPYILNGEAIEVDTQITVNFILGGGN